MPEFTFLDSGPFTFDCLLGEAHSFCSERAEVFVDYEVEVIQALQGAGKWVVCYVAWVGGKCSGSMGAYSPPQCLRKEMDG